jgi:hypothetical protein
MSRDPPPRTAAAQSYLLTSLTSGVWKQAERKDSVRSSEAVLSFATPAQGNYLQVGKNPSKKFRFFIWLKQSVAKTIDYPLKQLGT